MNRKYLTFSIDAVAPLVDQTKKAATHRLNIYDAFDPEMHLGGVVKTDGNGWPDAANIDPAKLVAALWLVKDQGCYLMSNAELPEHEFPLVAYAHEANPKELDFDTWWNASRDVMGGDDCAITLPIEWFEGLNLLGKSTFRLEVNANSIRLLP